VNIIRATAAGRPVRVGPRLLFLSPPSLRGLATLLSFLVGRIPAPEDAGPGWLPELVGDAAFEAYATPEGAMMLLYITTRRDHPGLDPEEAAELAAAMDDESIAALVRMAFVRGEARPSRKRKNADESRKGKGLEAVDLGKVFESEAARRFPPDVLADLTVDQFENLLFGGDTEPDESLTYDEVMEMYEAYRPRKAST
jgi:hypothetical protein